MNDVYGAIAGIMEHAYLIGAFTMIITIPARMIMRALHGRSPI